MKKRIKYYVEGRALERVVTYIPVRYILSFVFSLLIVLTVLAVIIALCFVVPYFYIATILLQGYCVVAIVVSPDNPDYKVSWLLLVLTLPVVGFMLYLLFYSRILQRKYVRRLQELRQHTYATDDQEHFARLRAISPTAHNQAQLLCQLSNTHLFTDTNVQYFPSGEEMFVSMLRDLREARSFILVEFFIIEEGKFWNSILDILREKVRMGVEVKVLYDDIGCMGTLPGNYGHRLRNYGIDATPFSRVRGNADSELNNRNHRKILVVDGLIGYTGGVNLADEYINAVERFGHWKDVGVRMHGEAVWELTRLFLIDFGLNFHESINLNQNYFPVCQASADAAKDDHFIVPFGDGPRPLYPRRIAKCAIENLINQATREVCITTPYLIIDNELCQTLENAALRGVKVRMILPHIPDKKSVFEMTRSTYPRLMQAGVEIYEYAPGFIHAKLYLADDEVALVGTFNLDYRSLAHHFEDGVWMYRCPCIQDIRRDFDETMAKCIRIDEGHLETTLSQRIVRAIGKVFAPLL